MKILYIIAGPPGSGKSTTAGIVEQGYYPRVKTEHYEDDMYFIKDGEYKFDASKIKDAHAWCQNQVMRAMHTYCPVIIVSNTFTKAWERKPYLDTAKENGYAVQYIYCTASFGNIHGVRNEVVQRMRDNYEPFNPTIEL